MKSNPYLTGLLTTAVLLLILGGLAFVVGLVANREFGAGVSVGAFLFPLGALALILWLHACAVVWTPADEPIRRPVS